MSMQGQFLDYVKRQGLNEKSSNALIESTQKIVKRTDLLTGEVANHCQLVIGEVQSGKTMSFTAVIALAHDNHFPIVVVLGGTKGILLSQTSDRLKKDLRTDGDGGSNPWEVIVKPEKKNLPQNLKTLQNTLKFWNDETAPQEFKPTVIITAMKNKAGMDAITELMQALKATFPLDSHPILIIDDEGDEAGLNLKHATDDESTIYSAIRRLRSNFLRHNYIMYTATPQGPLLIKLADSLSPKYVTLLTPGDEYVGGSTLFAAENSFFPKEIPLADLKLVFDSGKSAPVPPSLKTALAYYLLSLYVAQKRNNPKPISMLIHPSVNVDLHESYDRWVNFVLDSWSWILKDSNELIYQLDKEKFFIPAEQELRKSVDLGPDWDLDEVLTRNVIFWLTRIKVVVQNKTSDDIDARDWPKSAGWILIGGNKLSRGFTVENLAVTYMPRSIGTGNVDVIQQRGRFFGYKRKYLDLLRGWFFNDQIQAFLDYVSHETRMRMDLAEVDNGDALLFDWRRRFLLDPTYRMVRSQVISLDSSHRRLSRFKQHMLFDEKLPIRKAEAMRRAHELVKEYEVMPNDHRSTINNYFSAITVSEALELLADWPMSEDNRREMDDLIWALVAVRDEGRLDKAKLIFMDYDINTKTQRERERSMIKHKANPELTREDQSIANLFQGADKTVAVNYPGDDAMYFEDSLTIQIHHVTPLYEKNPQSSVAALAVLAPKGLPGFYVEN